MRLLRETHPHSRRSWTASGEPAAVEHASPVQEADGDRTPNAASTRIAAAAIDASRSPPWNSLYTTSGSVWVRPSMLPANMIVAPNSPSARAQVMTRPAASAVRASGNVIDRNSRHSEAPSTRAASSSSRSVPDDPGSSGADEERRRHERLREHDGERGERDRDPERASGSPRGRDARTRAAGRGRRPRAAARSAGRRRPRAARAPERPPSQHDRRAAGRTRRVITRLTAVVDQAERRGRRGRPGVVRAVASDPVDDRPDDEDDDREAEEQGEQARDEPQRHLPRGDALRPPGPVRPVRWVRRERVAARAGPGCHDAGGGRNPKLDRIAWPSGPANQLRNFEPRHPGSATP